MMSEPSELPWMNDVELDNVGHSALAAWFESFNSKDEYRVALKTLEQEMLSKPQMQLKTSHSFIDGVYAREMFAEAGAMVVGGLHTGDSINIMSSGDMTLVTEDGVKRIKAPYTEVSHAGTKRLAIMHSDTTWTTIIRTDLTDPIEIEKTFTADDYSAIEIEGE